MLTLKVLFPLAFLHLTFCAVIPPLLITLQPGTLLYTHFVPLTFTIPLPTAYDEEPLLALTPDSLNVCNSPSIDESPECPLMFYVQQIRDDLRPILTTKQSHQKPASSLPSPLRDGECGQMSSLLFPSLHTSPDIFQQVLTSLEKCLSTPLAPRVIPFFQSFLTPHYVDLNIGYHGTSKYIDSEVPHPIGKGATWLGGTALGWVHYLAERVRWVESLNQCKSSHTLPSLLIPDAVLEDELQKLGVKVTSMGYKLAVPLDDSFSPSYWTLPTVDCTLTEDPLSLQVVMQIPILPEDEVWSLYRASSVPFFTEQGYNYTCFLDEYEEEQRVLYEEGTKSAVILNGGKSSGTFLQHVQTPSGFLKDPATNCAALQISGAPDQDIVRHCGLDCHQIGVLEEGGVLLKKVSSTVVYVAKTIWEAR